jgi:hypothetical protein
MARARSGGWSILPRPPGRCRILPGKFAVRGLPEAKRRDAKAAGRSALDSELSRRQDARRVEDGPAALAGAVTRMRDGGTAGGGCGGNGAAAAARAVRPQR